MLNNLHSITEKKPIQTQSVRTTDERKISSFKKNIFLFVLLFYVIPLKAIVYNNHEWGRVYKLNDYMLASGGDATLAIKRCLTDIAERAYNYPGTYTLFIPLGNYEITEQLQPVNPAPLGASQIYTFKRDNTTYPLIINIIGLEMSVTDLNNMLIGETCPTTFIPEVTNQNQAFNYLSDSYLSNGIEFAMLPQVKDDILQAIPRNYIQFYSSNNSPASTSFLDIAQANLNRPKLQSIQLDGHNFFRIRFDATNQDLSNSTINIMGLHFEGLQNGSNSHIYNTTSLQHNTTFTGEPLLKL